MFNQSEHFVEVIIILRKNVSKGSDRKRKKLARLVFHLTEIRNVRLGNVIGVDLKFIWLQNVPSHLKTVRNDVSQCVLMKKVIMHATTEKMTMTIRYTHLWHVAPESKIQLVNCELSPYFSLSSSSSLDMRAIDAYIVWSLSSLLLSHARLPF